MIRWLGPVIVGLTIFGLVPWLLYVGIYPTALDGHAYYVAHLGTLYGKTLGDGDGLLYAPTFSQVIEPLRWLGWDGFRTAWRLLEVGALTILTGPLVGLMLFIPPISLEINMANVHLLVALAVVLGFRWPAAWSFVLLTKVTPGTGLLWFAVRREWRSLGIALGATAAIAAISFAFAPADWLGWMRVLASDPTRPAYSYPLLDVSLFIRLPLSAALVVWGARGNHRWTVIVAVFLALPAIWEHGLAVLVGLLWPLTRRLFETIRNGKPSIGQGSWLRTANATAGDWLAAILP
jgi:hypothetical protein